ncbi:hypothetical protein CHS0354_006280 [Potamilus streckersoni]|uniref:NAD kinase 2, mitochondrial n=1 Tax=Potamilus streckersoni TaxID=2493646 RepID=A0AAE0S4Y7_9BIVA|nr:hypothetical protein CHS0354_006280 [Potamilus streckersoni]
MNRALSFTFYKNIYNVYHSSRSDIFVFGRTVCSRTFSGDSHSDEFGTSKHPVFRPKRAAIIPRITRYEFEKKRYKCKDNEELKLILEQKRSDYQVLLARHEKHYKSVEIMRQSLEKNKIETKVFSRLEFTEDLLNWADVIFAAGGDGTFLLTASKIRQIHKPVIGINTDPKRSEGCLCLPKDKYSAANFDVTLQRLLSGNFKWKWKQRIRIIMSGLHDNDEPIELHDQQLQYLEHRYDEHIQEFQHCHRPIDLSKTTETPRILPVLALNEVFVGESLSSRVSYYEMSIDDGPVSKQKSSGVTVCTGTGSTSWYFHINHITNEAVRDILSIANRKSGVQLPLDNRFLSEVRKQYNNSLKFDPSVKRMAFTVRDPLINGVFKVPNPRGFAKRLQIRSRMWDACLVVDGGSSFQFNDGAVATMEIHDEDALRTVIFD